MWAAIFVISSLIEYYMESVLKMRWRTWLTERYTARWLDRGTHYRMGLFGPMPTTGPAHRRGMCAGFLNSTYAYSISLLSQVSNLVSFSLLLWSLPVALTIPAPPSSCRDAVLGGADLFGGRHLARPQDRQAADQARFRAGTP